MQKIIRKNGFVYLVENFDKKGFETFYNLGKDPDYWEENKKTKKTKKPEDV